MTQEPDHVAVAEVELDRIAALPLEAVHAEIGALQSFGGGQVVLLGPGEDDLDRVDQEYQFTAGAQYPGRSKVASVNGTCSALAWISGKRSLNRSCSSAAVAS